MPPEAGLKLRAEDSEDLAVISACLQDALVSVRDLAFDRDEGNFVLIANRFRWEAGAEADGSADRFERILCAVGFGSVAGVTYRGFRRDEEDRILSLLAIRRTALPEGTAIDLDFAAGATIRLQTSGIHCFVRDLGEPWPTNWQPDHPLDEPR